MTSNYNLKTLPLVRGSLLDDCAAALGMPRREVFDDTGHVTIYESDATYRKQLATWLRKLAAEVEKP